MKRFSCRTTIYSGPDALTALNLYPAERVLLITDRFFSGNGTTEEIRAVLPNSDFRVFDEVKPDPPVILAARGAAICREFQPQLVIALGGGSPMDCAKAICLAAGLEAPLIAIPTTSGTGSEMTSFSILSHDGVKHPLVDEDIRPDAAILDDRFLAELPAALIADAGMDLIAHCMEALAATNRSGFSDALAGAALKTAMELLPKSYAGDRSVRGAMHEAASMAGLAFDQAGLGVCHALAHAIGGEFHVSHGRLCGILLPSVLRYQTTAAMDAYTNAAVLCGCSGASGQLAVRNLVRKLERLRTMLQMPSGLGEAGIRQAQWECRKEAIYEHAVQDLCCTTNPVPVTMEGLEEICKAVAP